MSNVIVALISLLHVKTAGLSAYSGDRHATRGIEVLLQTSPRCIFPFLVREAEIHPLRLVLDKCLTPWDQASCYTQGHDTCTDISSSSLCE